VGRAILYSVDLALDKLAEFIEVVEANKTFSLHQCNIFITICILNEHGILTHSFAYMVYEFISIKDLKLKNILL